MKLRFAITAILLGSLLAFASINTAQAQWPAISSGYAVTTNWHGEDVPIGESVTAVAGTTDSEVEEVEFRWLDPDGNPVWEGDLTTVPVFGPYTTPNVPPGVISAGVQKIIDWAYDNPGVTIWYANDTKTPDVLGDWGVQAFFIDGSNPDKSLRGKNSDIIAIRATSLNVVPEVPFGTIAILLSMFGALGVFAMKRKHFSTAKPA